MLHQSKSNKLNLLKYTLIAPVLTGFFLMFNTKTEAKYTIIEKEQYSEIPYSADQDTIKKHVILHQDKTAFILHADMSDSEIDALKDKVSTAGGELKVKGLKRNPAGKITEVSLTYKLGKKKVSGSYQNTDGIGMVEFGSQESNNNTNLFMGNSSKEMVFLAPSGKNMSWTTGDSKTIVIEKTGDNEEIIEIKEDSPHKVFINSNGDISKGTGYSFTTDSLENHKIFISTDKGGSKIRQHVKITTIDSLNSKPGTGSKTFVYVTGKGTDSTMTWTNKNGNKTIHKIIVNDSLVTEDIINKTSDFHYIVTDDASQNMKKENVFVLKQDGEDPIYILNGKRVSKDEFQTMSPGEIKSVNVLKGKNAEEKYGKDAANGVIEITSGKMTTAPKDMMTYSLKEMEDAYIIIDDKESTKEELKKLDPEKIENVMIYKGDEAVKKYGDKAAKGAIIIKTKN